jgi:hypothetical protein
MSDDDYAFAAEFRGEEIAGIADATFVIDEEP